MVDAAGAVDLPIIGSVLGPAAIGIENPGASERTVWFRNYVATEIDAIHAVLKGSSTPSVTFTIRYDADRSATGTELLTSGRTVTNTTIGVNYPPDVTTIPAGVWVWVETSAQSGTVEELSITLNGLTT